MLGEVAGRDVPGLGCGAAQGSIDLATVLKNGRARAIRFSTLAALCQVLDCQPGDLLSHQA